MVGFYGSRGVERPGYTVIDGAHDGSVAHQREARIGIDKLEIEESVVCPTWLQGPGCAPVGGSDDVPHVTHGNGGIGICEDNRLQSLSCRARLRRPGFTAVRRPND